MRTITRPVTAVSILAIVAGAIVIAGPLDPPEGPVSGTYKTLAEVEPRIPIGPETTPGHEEAVYRITRPGSYYLTAEVTGAPNKHGILIESSNVTIDLGGFNLAGVENSRGGVAVIFTGYVNITVVNGGAVGWGGSGFELGNAQGVRLRDLHASLNGENGIETGMNAVVTGCVAIENAIRGITTGSWTTVSECTALRNVQAGMGGGRSVVFHGCTSYDNGTDGFSVGLGGLISGCSAEANGESGIALSRECTARENTSLGNNVGLSTGFGNNRIEDNVCTGNAVGYHISTDHNFLAGNTASMNTLNWDVVNGNAGRVVRMKLGSGFRGDEGGVSPGPAEPGLNYSFSL